MQVVFLHWQRVLSAGNVNCYLSALNMVKDRLPQHPVPWVQESQRIKKGERGGGRDGKENG